MGFEKVFLRRTTDNGQLTTGGEEVTYDESMDSKAVASNLKA
jgi:hypothetical protein